MRDIFIDRDEELNFLRSLKDEQFFLVLTGRRRIGKTALLLKAFPDAYYIFIWPNKSMDWLCEQISAELGIPHFKYFKDLLAYLLDSGKVVILDEFQNFLKVDKSVYGEIQKIVDMRRLKRLPLRLAVSGSSYSMMNKVFYSDASPLYGRRTHTLNLNELPLSDLYQWLNRNIEEFIQLWAVFGGVPYYYHLLNGKETVIDNLLRLFFISPAPLRDEGYAVLSAEFGPDAKVYYTILSLIAHGKTRLSEIASFFDNKPNIAIAYLDRLRRSFNLVKRLTPISADPRRSKQGVYQIRDNLLNFWFFFVEHNLPLWEQGRENEAVRFFKQNFSTYMGRMFERFVLHLIRKKYWNLHLLKVGPQWGKTKEGVYEVDLLGIPKKDEPILLGEVKWQDKVNPKTIAKDLLEKAEYLPSEIRDKPKRILLVAKSFARRISELDGVPVECVDLKGIERMLKRRNV